TGVQYLFTHDKSPGGKALPARTKLSIVKCLRRAITARRRRGAGRRDVKFVSCRGVIVAVRCRSAEPDAITIPQKRLMQTGTIVASAGFAPHVPACFPAEFAANPRPLGDWLR